MKEDILIGLAAIVIAGVLAQWIAWRVRLPSILLLLLVGILIGPVFNLIDPEAVLGDVMFSIVSLAVAIILFEGGLSLRFREIRDVLAPVRNLVTVGILVTFFLSAVAAVYILNLNLQVAVLLGSILVVTGPTVIIPLIRHLQLSSRMASVAKWEGIINDPIGALLAVLIFEIILAGGLEQAPSIALAGIVKTVLTGFGLGYIGAMFLALIFQRYWVPDNLQNPMTLMVVFTVFTVSNVIQAEAGLFSVTILGIILANQSRASIRHIIEFKENLRVVLIASLFIILSARLRPADLALIDLSGAMFLGVLILVVRPVAVFASTIGTSLSFRERVFLSFLAPRGIVAAAVSSLFALELADAGIAQAEYLMSYTFLVIIGTVVLYSLIAPPLSRILKLSHPDPQGVLIIGAHEWARQMAQSLMREKLTVTMVDNNWHNISQARMAGIPAHYGSILSDTIFEEIDLTGIGKMIALTSNDEVNNLAAIHFTEIFGRADVYQLATSGDIGESKKQTSRSLKGRTIFKNKMSFDQLQDLFSGGAVFKRSNITSEFSYDRFLDQYDYRIIPLFIISGNKKLSVITTGDEIDPEPGAGLINIHCPQAKPDTEKNH